MHETMDRIIGSSVAQLEDYCLPENSEPIKAYLDQCRVRGAGALLQASLAAGGLVPPPLQSKWASRDASCRNGKKMPQWERQHEAEYEADPDLWRPESLHFSPNLLLSFPGLHALEQRNVECLQLAGVRAFPERRAQTYELLHSLGRGSTLRVGQASCILPSGSQYLTHRCRIMHPLESLALQGIFVDKAITDEISLNTLQSLAGNAFQTSCVVGAMCCTLAVLSRNCVESLPAVGRALPATEHVDSEPSSESESEFTAPKLRRLF